MDDACHTYGISTITLKNRWAAFVGHSQSASTINYQLSTTNWKLAPDRIASLNPVRVQVRRPSDLRNAAHNLNSRHEHRRRVRRVCPHHICEVFLFRVNNANIHLSYRPIDDLSHPDTSFISSKRFKLSPVLSEASSGFIFFSPPSCTSKTRLHATLARASLSAVPT